MYRVRSVLPIPERKAKATELAKKLQWRCTVEFSAHNNEKFLQKQRHNEHPCHTHEDGHSEY